MVEIPNDAAGESRSGHLEPTRRLRARRTSARRDHKGAPKIQRWLAAHRPAVSPALHPDHQQLAEPRRALVRRGDQQVTQAWRAAPSARRNVDIRGWIERWNENPRTVYGPNLRNGSWNRSPGAANESTKRQTRTRASGASAMWPNVARRAPARAREGSRRKPRPDARRWELADVGVLRWHACVARFPDRWLCHDPAGRRRGVTIPSS